jgi:glycerol-3-phosphate dehydrogenase subunit B
LPAILGMGSVQDIHGELEDRLGVSIFEIPTLPASVPGLRMMEALKRAADASPLIQTFAQSRVTEIHQDSEGWFQATVQEASMERVLRSRAVILATGRFLGQGLTAERKGVREPLLDIPVHQPGSRAEWHRDDFFDPRGHPLNLAGIEVDDCFQPLGSNSKPVYANLYAAGSILAHQDWVRMKCGAGLAIASAFQAVQCCRTRLAKEHQTGPV